MENFDVNVIALAQWEKSFRDAADADSYEVFKKLLISLNLPDDPSLLLDGTIAFVQCCVAYMTIDNQQVMDFLAMQQYDPTKVVDAPYRVTFDLHQRAYACLNLPASLGALDLADLYGTPWDDYRVVGYCDFWIERADGVALNPEEISGFEKVVENDLRFDYAEDELSFWSDPDTHKGVLKFTVQDVYEFDDDDDDDNARSIKTSVDDTSNTESK